MKSVFLTNLFFRALQTVSIATMIVQLLLPVAIAAAALEKQNGVAIYYCGQPDTNTPHNGGYTARYNATAGFQKMPETQVALGTVKQNDGWAGADSEYQGWK